MAKNGEEWFDDGLAFECTRCGNCCTGAPGYVWVNDEEIDALAAARGEPRHEFVALYTRKARGKRTIKEKANGDCVFFERGQGCTVYAHRPRQCRTWPFWDSVIDTPETWDRTAENCPGMNKGELIPKLEILRRAAVIAM